MHICEDICIYACIYAYMRAYMDICARRLRPHTHSRGGRGGGEVMPSFLIINVPFKSINGDLDLYLHARVYIASWLKCGG